MAVWIIDYEIISENKFSEISNMKPPAGGIANTDRTKISFAYREIPVASFAFVLHSEFPEPGMYDIRKLDENRMIRAMLWNPERLLHALYELRNEGLISKVSEIHNIRQFTTKHTLSGVVKQIVSGGKAMKSTEIIEAD